MLLNPPEVTGYALDGVIPTLGASPDQFTYTSSLETGFGDVADKFIALCDEDKVCNNRFKKKGLKSTLQQLMTKLDSKPNTSCAKLLKTANIVQDEDPPSFTLRYLLGLLLTDPSLRTLIPPTVYRFLRCAKKDVDVLTHLIKVITSSKVDTLSSFLLYNLIPISEMWETPPPSVSKLRAQFEANLMSSWALYMNVSEYSPYSKEKSPVCNKLKLGNYEGNGIIYERDEYCNKPAKIPDQASILLLSSEMDPVVSSKFAEYFFEALNGKDKELITLKNNAQGSLMNSRTMEPMCGMELLISYVKSKGNLAKLERACVKSEMSLLFNWTTLGTEQYNFFSTADVYDGEFDSSLNSQLLGEDSNGNSDSAASA